MNPETWTKLLFNYGPFALVVLFLIVGENRARSALKDPGVKNKLLVGVIYAANWAAIFTLLGFAQWTWNRLNFNSEFVIRGWLKNLQGAETAASETSDLFLQRRYGPGGHFDYQWRMITTRPLPEGTKVPFTLGLGTPESEKVRDYELTIHPDYYKNEVRIVYDRRQDRLILDSGGRHEELQPLPEQTGQNHEPGRRGPLNWTVHAQETTHQVPLQERLESGDPIMRKQARADLAKEQTAQWKFIDDSLANRASSYRLRLGVIAALNANKCAEIRKLSPAALAGLIDASGDPDPALHSEARRCLVAQASPAIDAGLDKAIHDARSPVQSAASGSSSQHIAELARTQLEVLYELGIRAKDRYGSRQQQDHAEIDRALAAFRKAWGLRTLGASAARVAFAKALYGWGLTLHDRSWIERDSAHKRNPVLIRAAQDKFTEFLREVRATENPRAYPYPEHLKRAEAYVRNPQPESLQLN